MANETGPVLRFKYQNYRGEVANRRVVEPKIHYGDKNGYYEPNQWFLSAHDLDKEARRTFAVKNILEWF